MVFRAVLAEGHMMNFTATVVGDLPADCLSPANHHDLICLLSMNRELAIERRDSAFICSSDFYQICIGDLLMT